MAIINVICDGNSKYGFGHIRRSMSMSDQLSDFGHHVDMTILSEDGRNSFSTSKNVRSNVSNDADIWMIDLPYCGDSVLSQVKSHGAKRVLGLDYDGEMIPDLVISIHDRGTASAKAKNLIGLQYAIIREDVSTISPVFDGEGVLVMIGGADIVGLGETVSSRLVNFGRKITLIKGPLASREDYQEQPEYKILRNPDDLAQLMAGCRWAVVNGGTTMLEMMCLGKAVHIIPQSQFEELLANRVYEMGGVLGVGLDEMEVPSSERINMVAERARQLVDGRGAKRILMAVESLL